MGPGESRASSRADGVAPCACCSLPASRHSRRSTFLPSLTAPTPHPVTRSSSSQPFMRQTSPEVVVFDWSVAGARTSTSPTRRRRPSKRQRQGQLHGRALHLDYPLDRDSTLDAPTAPVHRAHELTRERRLSKSTQRSLTPSPWTPEGRRSTAAHERVQGEASYLSAPLLWRVLGGSLSLAVSRTRARRSPTPAAGPPTWSPAHSVPVQMNGPNGSSRPATSPHG